MKVLPRCVYYKKLDSLLVFTYIVFVLLHLCVYVCMCTTISVVVVIVVVASSCVLLPLHMYLLVDKLPLACEHNIVVYSNILASVAAEFNNHNIDLYKYLHNLPSNIHYFIFIYIYVRIIYNSFMSPTHLFLYMYVCIYIFIIYSHTIIIIIHLHHSWFDSLFSSSVVMCLRIPGKNLHKSERKILVKTNLPCSAQHTTEHSNMADD